MICVTFVTEILQIIIELEALCISNFRGSSQRGKTELREVMASLKSLSIPVFRSPESDSCRSSTAFEQDKHIVYSFLIKKHIVYSFLIKVEAAGLPQCAWDPALGRQSQEDEESKPPSDTAAYLRPALPWEKIEVVMVGCGVTEAYNLHCWSLKQQNTYFEASLEYIMRPCLKT